MKCIWTMTLLMISMAYGLTNAQVPGSLDQSYGDQGKKILPLGNGNAFGRDMVIQPDGKTLIAGIANAVASNDFAVIRVNSDGQPDPDFGNNGIVFTDFQFTTDVAEAITLDHQNRIIVAGYVEAQSEFDFAVARYLPDGELDDSFSDDGLANIKIGINGFCKAVAVQHDDKIVLGGYALNAFTSKNEFAMVRFRTNGVVDSTFGENGVVQTNFGIGSAVANAMLIQPDGKIILAGQVFNESTFTWEIGMARYLDNGSLDESFDDDGLVLTASPLVNHTINAVAFQPDQKIIVGGFNGTAPSNNLFTVARYNPDGSPDENFGNQGLVIDSYGAEDNQVNTIAVQSDGNILIAGTTLIGNADHFAIARLNEDGARDNAFGDHGIVIDEFGQNDGIEAMDLQQDGKLVVVGETFNGTRFALFAARYETGLQTAIHDPNIYISELSFFPNPATEKITINYTIEKPALVRISLYSSEGRLLKIFKSDHSVFFGKNIETLVLPDDLVTGIYCLTLQADTETRTQKLIITN